MASICLGLNVLKCTVDWDIPASSRPRVSIPTRPSGHNLYAFQSLSRYSYVIMDAMASQITGVPFIQTQIKEIIKAPRHWPLYGEFTGDRWISLTMGQ